MKSLHTSLNTDHSGCKPSTFMSSSTHSSQVSLFLSLHLAPATSTFLQADTQSSALLRSRCPNHLNLKCLTTSATLCTPKRLYKYKSHCTSYPSATSPHHIHLTIIRSILSRQVFFISPGFSPICQYTLDMSLVYLSLYAVCGYAVLFMCYGMVADSLINFHCYMAYLGGGIGPLPPLWSDQISHGSGREKVRHGMWNPFVNS